MKGSMMAFVAGGLTLLAGIVALIFPLPAGIAVTTFTGIAFVVFGALGLFGAWQDQTLRHRWWLAFMSLLQLILGVAILANPLAGLISLTILAGGFFLASGVVRLVMAWRLRGQDQAPTLLLVITGLLSLGLAGYVFFYPAAATAVLLGTLLAVELISAGAALIAMGMALRKFTGKSNG